MISLNGLNILLKNVSKLETRRIKKMPYNGNGYTSKILNNDKRSFYTYIASDNKRLDGLTSTFNYVKNPTSSLIELIKKHYNNENYEYKHSIWNLDLTNNSTDILIAYFSIKILNFFEKIFNNTDFGYKTCKSTYDGKEYFKLIYPLYSYHLNNKRQSLFNPIISNIKQFITDVEPCLLVIQVPNVGTNNSLLKCISKILDKNTINSKSIIYIKN